MFPLPSRALGMFALLMIIGVAIGNSGEQQTQQRTMTYVSGSTGPTRNQQVMARASALTSIRTDLYPKEVLISSLDSRFRSWLGGARGKKIAVQLALGVYSERGSSPDLGTLEDYNSYVGLCSDVKRYSQVHPGGYVCW